MWNTKPPLMIWCQVISMKLLGINEWAIRLPSALAALFTCAIIMLIAVRYVKNFWFGFISRMNKNITNRPLYIVDKTNIEG